MDVRLGNQIPTQSFIIPYTKTYGDDAAELYNSSGKTAQEWQVNLLRDILAYNDEELYVHTKFGYSLPRRNGKNEVITMREAWGLKNGEHILHTAHRTSTTHVAWERLLRLLEDTGVSVVSSYRAFGKEHIEVLGGGVIEFRTRTTKGGLGEGYDLLIIDEAQEYEDDHETALKYVVSDSKNPQTIFCGTPPTPISSGTVFTKFRDNTLKGKNSNSGWAEWSIEAKGEPDNKELWYLTNPSLGTILTERKIQDEITGDSDEVVMDFNIQRLGLWVKYSLKSEISEVDWDNLKVLNPQFIGKLFVGIKYGIDGTNVALSIAVKTKDNRIFIECLNCKSVREGNDWIINILKTYPIDKVIVDGAIGQNILLKDMKDYGLKIPIMPTVKEVITANAMFEQAIFNKTVCHNNQPSLREVATNVDKRNIGTGGGFGYKSLKPLNDIVLLDSAILAHWACATQKEHKKQKITY